jgi:putative DNA primase/helicase
MAGRRRIRLSSKRTASLLSQVLTLLKAKLAVKDDLLSFVANPPPVINCANGEVWISPDGTVDLRPHRPESHLRHCLDVVYDPDAACPEYDKALLEIFAKADNPKAMVRHWNELVGYVIQPKRNIPVIVIMSGAGDNGKTVLIRTVMRLLGTDLVHAQRVEDLDKSRFAIGSLFGKYLFVDDDVRAGARLPDGMLKTISEAKEVTGELKYRPSFNFVVRTVPVLLCNNIPSVADLSHGMRRRLMVLPFDRIFTEEEKDPDLFEGIWDKELPGVLNQAPSAATSGCSNAAPSSSVQKMSAKQPPIGSSRRTPYRRSSRPIVSKRLRAVASLRTFTPAIQLGPRAWGTL